MFVVFSFLVLLGYRHEYCKRDKAYRIKLQLITLIVAFGYGALTEIMQKHVFVGRCGSIYDFLADVIGCILGVFIFKIIFLKKMRKNCSSIQ